MSSVVLNDAFVSVLTRRVTVRSFVCVAFAMMKKTSSRIRELVRFLNEVETR
jgi:hypothetical protein